MNIVIHAAFIDALFQIQLQEEINNQNIIDYKNYIKSKEPEGVIRSNDEGWQLDIPRGVCHEIEKMVCLMEDNVTDIFNNVYGFDTKIQLANMWLNENPRGGSNAYHTHPGCIFSGVYYIAATGDPEQGQICIQRDSHHVYADLNTRSHKVEPQGNVDSPEIRTHANFIAQEGSAYVFPPHFNHMVTKNNTDISRVVMGMNFQAV